MRVIIAGGSGLIGRALARELAAAGYEVVILTRSPQRATGLPAGARAVPWDARTAAGWGSLIDGDTAIVNLAGASIGLPPLPWTAERKRRIRQSRLDASRAVAEAIATAPTRPRVLVQGSAVGYYGNRGDALLTEETPAGQDFVAGVCVDWEAATAEVEALGVRRVVVRSGVVLDRHAGMLPIIALPFRFFVGGPLGGGRQWLSWIHLADQVRAIRFLIETEAARGVFNLTSPNPCTNAELSRALGRALRRPAFLSVPAIALRLALGELADALVLISQRAVPARLLELGFAFQFPDLEPALKDLLA